MTSTKHPPGPNDTWLGEVLIHAEDIRRPLGIRHDYPAEAAAQVADADKGSNLVMGSKNRSPACPCARPTPTGGTATAPTSPGR